MNNVLSFPIEGLETCAFEESAHLLKLTLRAAGAGTWALDLRTGESVWSDEIFPLLGVTREHCVPSYDSWLALVHPEDRDRARQCIDAALQDRTPFEVEFRNVHPDGTIHWLKSKGNAVYSRGGTPVRMVGITFDVTQRKATEERLRFREQQLAAIADGVPVLISYVDADQRYQFNNRLYEQWFGIARGELIGKRVREVVGEAAYRGLLPHLERALSGTEVKFESRLDYVGAGTRDIEVQYLPHRGGEGEVHGVFVLVHDVSAYKSIERQLREKQRLMEQLIETSSAAIFVKDLHGRYLLANPRARSNLRSSPAIDPIGLTDRDLLPAEVADAIERNEELVLRTRSAVEVEESLCDASGECRTYLAVKFPLLGEDDEPIAVCGVATDITDRKAAEAELRASNRRFVRAFEAAPCGMAILGLSDGRALDVNDAFCEMTGFAREELIGQSLRETQLWSPEDYDRITAAWRARGRLRNETFVCRGKEGTPLHFSLSSEVIELDGQSCVLAAVRDDTACKEAERIIRMSEEAARARAEELAAILEESPAIVWIATDEGCSTVAGSRAARDLLGMPDVENFSKSGAAGAQLAHMKVFHADRELAPPEMPLQRAARGETLRDYETRLVFDDGREVHLFGSAVPLKDAEGNLRGAIGAFVDVSSLKSVEAALQDADRRKDAFLAILGHEVRSPLSAIRSAAALMKDGAPPGMVDKVATIVERQSLQIERMIADLLDVSRIRLGKIDVRRKRIEVSEFLTRAIEASRAQIDGGSHPLRLSFPPDALHVLGDAGRLAQAMSNLLSNAARYSPHGAPIDVTVSAREGFATIVVRDEGVGFDAATRATLFRLFSQSDRAGGASKGGLGIGLALSKELVELHGGTIDARSPGPDRGSEFEMRIPLMPD